MNRNQTGSHLKSYCVARLDDRASRDNTGFDEELNLEQATFGIESLSLLVRSNKCFNDQLMAIF